MKKWSERPKEIANLMNPAFCSLVITSSAMGYYEYNSSKICYPLILISLSLILNNNTRWKLPRTIRTSLPLWIQSNLSDTIGLLDMTEDIKQIVNEAIIWGHTHDLFSFNPGGLIQPKSDFKRLTKSIPKSNKYIIEFVNQSYLLGKWLAKSGSPNTVMQLWRISL